MTNTENNIEMGEDELDRWRGESPAAGRVSATDEGANMVAKKIRGIASHIKGASVEPQVKSSQMQRIKNNVSSYLHTAASYVEDTCPDRLRANIENQVRRNPGRSLLIVGALGLLLGSLIRKRPSE